MYVKLSGNFNLDVCEMNEMAFFSVSFLSVNTFTTLKKSSKSCPPLIWTFELKFKYFKLSKFFNIWVKATKNFRRYIEETYFHEKNLISLFFRLSKPVLAAELTKSFVFLLFSPIWLLWCHWLLPEQLSSIHWLRYVVLFPYIWFQRYQLYLLDLHQMFQKMPNSVTMKLKINFLFRKNTERSLHIFWIVL